MYCRNGALGLNHRTKQQALHVVKSRLTQHETNHFKTFHQKYPIFEALC